MFICLWVCLQTCRRVATPFKGVTQEHDQMVEKHLSHCTLSVTALVLKRFLHKITEICSVITVSSSNKQQVDGLSPSLGATWLD